MKKLLLVLLFCPFILIGQTQIGTNIVGDIEGILFGYKVSLSSDGNILAISSPQTDVNGVDSGSVRIYKNNLGVWEQIGDAINGKDRVDGTGVSLSLSSDGSIVAIGSTASYEDVYGSGYVRVYKNNLGVWEQIGLTIVGEVVLEGLGYSIDLSSDGNMIAITSPNTQEQNTGLVKIFKNNYGVWEQLGATIIGESPSDGSGYSVSLSSDGNIVAIGAPFNDGNGSNSGHVRIYRNNLGVWEQIGSDIDGETLNDGSGRTVSLSSNGDIVAIGATSNDGNGYNSGHVRVYKNNLGVWEQIGSDINGEARNDESGFSISLSSDGNIVAISSVFNVSNNGANRGHVRIYKNNSGIWEQIGVDIDGDYADGTFGWSIGLSSDGSKVAIGNPYDPFGYVKVFDLSAILSSDSFVLSKFSLFPNPAKNKVIIQLEDNLVIKKVSIYNNLGQFIKASKELTINTTNLNTGIYFVEIETTEGKATKKLIIE